MIMNAIILSKVKVIAVVREPGIHVGAAFQRPKLPANANAQ